MAARDRDKKARLEEKFLERVRVKAKEKQAKNVAHALALSRMEMEGCTFKPLKRIPCPVRSCNFALSNLPHSGKPDVVRRKNLICGNPICSCRPKLGMQWSTRVA